MHLANIFHHADYPDESNRWLRAAIAAREPTASWFMAEQLEKRGKNSWSAVWRRRAESLGDERALKNLSDRTDMGDDGRGNLRRLKLLAREGYPTAMETLAQALLRRGKRAAGLRWARRAAGLGRAGPKLRLVMMLDPDEDQAEIAELVRHMGQNVSDPEDIEAIHQVLEGAGRSAEVEILLQAAAEVGMPYAMDVIRITKHEDDPEGNKYWLRRMADHEDPWGAEMLAELFDREEPGLGDEWLWGAAYAGNRGAMQALAAFRGEDMWLPVIAEKEYTDAAVQVLTWFAGGTREKDEWSARRRMLTTPFRDITDLWNLQDVLERTGRTEESARLKRFGLEPCGCTATGLSDVDAPAPDHHERITM
jgi:hypothetical protein